MGEKTINRKFHPHDADFQGFAASMIYLLKEADLYDLQFTRAALLSSLNALLNDLKNIGVYESNLIVLRKFLEQHIDPMAGSAVLRNPTETPH